MSRSLRSNGWEYPRIRKSKKRIPYGEYCYTVTDIQEGNLIVDSCPYWAIHPNRSQQEGGYCAYLGYGDWMWGKGWGLLWDQVKECNINRSKI